ncbi:hypothetical protein GCM10010371_32800 [Streptomyces subrutilus]|uniref:Uncharacterized protein n=1 Tax=Streptomyces subrutilus TaxID=36818 RepID=A0A918V4K0_9ACTN|nr:hypothetical protein GCM10010371_32800 [Streptomyces subrutilus]
MPVGRRVEVEGRIEEQVGECGGDTGADGHGDVLCPGVPTEKCVRCARFQRNPNPYACGAHANVEAWTMTRSAARAPARTRAPDPAREI